MDLTKKIFIGLVLGFAVGILINLIRDVAFFGYIDKFLVNGVFHILGSVFVRLLQFMMIPIVVTSLIVGITNIKTISEVAKLGSKTVLIFLITTVIAISLSITFSYLFNIGEGYTGFDISQGTTVREAGSFADIVINMFPSNILSPIVNVSMLQVILLSIIVGISIISLGQNENKAIISVMKKLEQLSLAMVSLIMKFSPYGVFGLVAKVFATQGFSVASHVALYGFVVLLTLVILLLLVQPFIVKLGGLNPFTYLKKCWNVILVAFSTSSSNATLPVTLQTAEKRLGIQNSVAGFVIPLGATINMNGTSVMLGAATIFISNIYGINLSFLDIIGIVSLATVAAIGTAGVPGVGIIMLSMILTQYNIPLEGIALILTIDRILDMSRTAVNVMGDLAVTTFIASKDNKIDIDIFNSKDT